MATFSVVLPSLIIILIFAAIYSKISKNRFLRGAFDGIKPVVTGLISAAGVSIALQVILPLMNLKDFSSADSWFDKFDWVSLILVAAAFGASPYQNKEQKIKSRHIDSRRRGGRLPCVRAAYTRSGAGIPCGGLEIKEISFMLKTNRDRLVMQSVTGKVHNPTVRGGVYRVTTEGKPVAYPTVGAICYNVTLGDSVFGWVGDHIEPDVSTQNADSAENGAYNFLSCIGNRARVISGDAKGREGFVTGTHGGIEHVIVWFDRETKELLAPDDKILVKSFGQGLEIEGFEDIRVMNIDPDLFEKLNIKIGGRQTERGSKSRYSREIYGQRHRKSGVFGGLRHYDGEQGRA